MVNWSLKLSKGKNQIKKDQRKEADFSPTMNKEYKLRRSKAVTSQKFRLGQRGKTTGEKPALPNKVTIYLTTTNQFRLEQL